MFKIEMEVHEVAVLIAASTQEAVRLSEAKEGIAYSMADTNEKLIARILEEHPDLPNVTKALLLAVSIKCDDILNSTRFMYDTEAERVVTVM